MIDALLTYQYLQHAVIAAILASVACGVIGVIITEKRLVMMSGGIAHTSFGGVGLGYFLKIEPIIGALAVSVLAALGIAGIRRNSNTNPDLLIGIFWSVGMALGILLVYRMPEYPPDLQSYLFGDILGVLRVDLGIMAVLDVIVALVVLAYFNLFKAYIFDEEFAAVRGVNVRFLEYLLFVLIALTVVVLIRVVGIILIIALLTAPPAIARQFSGDLQKIMAASILWGMAFCLTGLWVSYELVIPSGATIIMVAAAAYLAVTLLRRILSAGGHRRAPHSLPAMGEAGAAGHTEE